MIFTHENRLFLAFLLLISLQDAGQSVITQSTLCKHDFFIHADVPSAQFNYCWNVINERISGSEADARCSVFNGKPPAVNTVTKANKISDYILETSKLGFRPDENDDEIWISPITEGKWHATDITVTFVASSESGESVQPHACVLFNLKRKKWHYTDCKEQSGDRHGVLCEETGHPDYPNERDEDKITKPVDLSLTNSTKSTRATTENPEIKKMKAEVKQAEHAKNSSTSKPKPIGHKDKPTTKRTTTSTTSTTTTKPHLSHGPAQPDVDDCPQKFTSFEDACYLIIPKDTLPSQASALCKHENGSIAQFKSLTDFKNIKEFMNNEDLVMTEGNILIDSLKLNPSNEFIWSTSMDSAKYVTDKMKNKYCFLRAAYKNLYVQSPLMLTVSRKGELINCVDEDCRKFPLCIRRQAENSEEGNEADNDDAHLYAHFNRNCPPSPAAITDIQPEDQPTVTQAPVGPTALSGEGEEHVQEVPNSGEPVQEGVQNSEEPVQEEVPNSEEPVQVVSNSEEPVQEEVPNSEEPVQGQEVLNSGEPAQEVMNSEEPAQEEMPSDGAIDQEESKLVKPKKKTARREQTNQTAVHGITTPVTKPLNHKTTRKGETTLHLHHVITEPGYGNTTSPPPRGARTNGDDQANQDDAPTTFNPDAKPTNNPDDAPTTFNPDAKPTNNPDDAVTTTGNPVSADSVPDKPHTGEAAAGEAEEGKESYCPVLYTSFDGECFNIVHEQVMPNQAGEICQDKGGHPAQFITIQQFQRIVDYIKAQSKEIICDGILIDSLLVDGDYKLHWAQSSASAEQVADELKGKYSFFVQMNRHAESKLELFISGAGELIHCQTTPCEKFILCMAAKKLLPSTARKLLTTAPATNPTAEPPKTTTQPPKTTTPKTTPKKHTTTTRKPTTLAKPPSTKKENMVDHNNEGGNIASCPEKFTVFQQKCYRIITKLTLPSKAGALCHEAGGQIAEFTTMAQFRDIQQFVTSQHHAITAGSLLIDSLMVNHDYSFIWSETLNDAREITQELTGRYVFLKLTNRQLHKKLILTISGTGELMHCQTTPCERFPLCMATMDAAPPEAAQSVKGGNPVPPPPAVQNVQGGNPVPAPIAVQNVKGGNAPAPMGVQRMQGGNPVPPSRAILSVNGGNPVSAPTEVQSAQGDNSEINDGGDFKSYSDADIPSDNEDESTGIAEMSGIAEDQELSFPEDEEKVEAKRLTDHKVDPATDIGPVSIVDEHIGNNNGISIGLDPSIVIPGLNEPDLSDVDSKKSFPEKENYKRLVNHVNRFLPAYTNTGAIPKPYSAPQQGQVQAPNSAIQNIQVQTGKPAAPNGNVHTGNPAAPNGNVQTGNPTAPNGNVQMANPAIQNTQIQTENSAIQQPKVSTIGTAVHQPSLPAGNIPVDKTATAMDNIKALTGSIVNNIAHGINAHNVSSEETSEMVTDLIELIGQYTQHVAQAGHRKPSTESPTMPHTAPSHHTPGSYCSNGFRKFEDACYLILLRTTLPSEAGLVCKNEGGRIAQFTSLTQFKHIVDFVKFQKYEVTSHNILIDRLVVDTNNKLVWSQSRDMATPTTTSMSAKYTFLRPDKTQIFAKDGLTLAISHIGDLIHCEALPCKMYPLCMSPLKHPAKHVDAAAAHAKTLGNLQTIKTWLDGLQQKIANIEREEVVQTTIQHYNDLIKQLKEEHDLQKAEATDRHNSDVYTASILSKIAQNALPTSHEASAKASNQLDTIKELLKDIHGRLGHIEQKQPVATNQDEDSHRKMDKYSNDLEYVKKWLMSVHQRLGDLEQEKTTTTLPTTTKSSHAKLDDLLKAVNGIGKRLEYLEKLQLHSQKSTSTGNKSKKSTSTVKNKYNGKKPMSTVSKTNGGTGHKARDTTHNTSSTGTNGSSGCQGRFREFRGSCYKILYPPMVLGVGEEMCQKKESHIAQFTNMSQFKDIGQYIKRQKPELTDGGVLIDSLLMKSNGKFIWAHSLDNAEPIVKKLKDLYPFLENVDRKRSPKTSITLTIGPEGELMHCKVVPCKKNVLCMAAMTTSVPSLSDLVTTTTSKPPLLPLTTSTTPLLPLTTSKPPPIPPTTSTTPLPPTTTTSSIPIIDADIEVEEFDDDSDMETAESEINADSKNLALSADGEFVHQRHPKDILGTVKNWVKRIEKKIEKKPDNSSVTDTNGTEHNGQNIRDTGEEDDEEENDSSLCPDKFRAFKDSCYRFVHPAESDFEPEKICKRKGGFVAYFTNITQFRSIGKFIKHRKLNFTKDGVLIDSLVMKSNGKFIWAQSLDNAQPVVKKLMYQYTFLDTTTWNSSTNSNITLAMRSDGELMQCQTKACKKNLLCMAPRLKSQSLISEPESIPPVPEVVPNIHRDPELNIADLQKGSDHKEEKENHKSSTVNNKHKVFAGKESDIIKEAVNNQGSTVYSNHKVLADLDKDFDIVEKEENGEESTLLSRQKEIIADLDKVSELLEKDENNEASSSNNRHKVRDTHQDMSARQDISSDNEDDMDNENSACPDKFKEFKGNCYRIVHPSKLVKTSEILCQRKSGHVAQFTKVWQFENIGKFIERRNSIETDGGVLIDNLMLRNNGSVFWAQSSDKADSVVNKLMRRYSFLGKSKNESIKLNITKHITLAITPDGELMHCMDDLCKKNILCMVPLIKVNASISQSEYLPPVTLATPQVAPSIPDIDTDIDILAVDEDSDIDTIKDEKKSKAPASTGTSSSLTDTLDSEFTDTGSDLTDLSSDSTDTGSDLSDTGSDLGDTDSDLTDTSSDTSSDLTDTGSDLTDTGSDIHRHGARDTHEDESADTDDDDDDDDDESSICPMRFREFRDNCYKIISRVTFLRPAAKLCQIKGGHIAQFTNVTQFRNIGRFIKHRKANLTEGGVLIDSLMIKKNGKHIWAQSLDSAEPVVKKLKDQYAFLEKDIKKRSIFPMISLAISPNGELINCKSEGCMKKILCVAPKNSTGLSMMPDSDSKRDVGTNPHTETKLDDIEGEEDFETDTIDDLTQEEEDENGQESPTTYTDSIIHKLHQVRDIHEDVFPRAVDTDESLTCPLHFREFREICYNLIRRAKFLRPAAKLCEIKGGHIAQFTSMTQFRNIGRFISHRKANLTEGGVLIDSLMINENGTFIWAQSSDNAETVVKKLKHEYTFLEDDKKKRSILPKISLAISPKGELMNCKSEVCMKNILCMAPKNSSAPLMLPESETKQDETRSLHMDLQLDDTEGEDDHETDTTQEEDTDSIIHKLHKVRDIHEDVFPRAVDSVDDDHETHTTQEEDTDSLIHKLHKVRDIHEDVFPRAVDGDESLICPMRFMEFRDSCYNIIRRATSRPAEKLCEIKGGHIAQFTNITQFRNIGRFIRRRKANLTEGGVLIDSLLRRSNGKFIWAKSSDNAQPVVKRLMDQYPFLRVISRKRKRSIQSMESLAISPTGELMHCMADTCRRKILCMAAKQRHTLSVPHSHTMPESTVNLDDDDDGITDVGNDADSENDDDDIDSAADESISAHVQRRDNNENHEDSEHEIYLYVPLRSRTP